MKRRSAGVSSGALIAVAAVIVILVAAGASYYFFLGPSATEISNTAADSSSSSSSCSTTSNVVGSLQSSSVVTTNSMACGGGAGGGGGTQTSIASSYSTTSPVTESSGLTSTNSTDVEATMEISGNYQYNGTEDPGPESTTWWAAEHFTVYLDLKTNEGTGDGDGDFQYVNYANDPCNVTAYDFDYTFSVDAHYSPSSGNYTFEFSGPMPPMYNTTITCPDEGHNGTSSDHLESVVPNSITVNPTLFVLDGYEDGVEYHIEVST